MDIRSVLIVHGRGEKSNPPALIKSYLANWLTQIKDVQSAHSAQAFHGGTGAVYVMLRKSSEKKLDNRERHKNGAVKRRPYSIKTLVVECPNSLRTLVSPPVFRCETLKREHYAIRTKAPE